MVVLRGAGPKHEWNPTYRSPLYPLPQIYGTVAGIFMLVLMGKKALFGGGGAILLGILAWYAYGRKNVKPRDGSTPLNAFLGRDDSDAEKGS